MEEQDSCRHGRFDCNVVGEGCNGRDDDGFDAFTAQCVPPFIGKADCRCVLAGFSVSPGEKLVMRKPKPEVEHNVFHTIRYYIIITYIYTHIYTYIHIYTHITHIHIYIYVYLFI